MKLPQMDSERLEKSSPSLKSSSIIMEQLVEPQAECGRPTNSYHKTLNIKSEFNLIRTLAKSSFGKVILGKKDGEKMVLKVFQSKAVSWDEFQKELNYNYFLSPHPNVVTSYNVSFEWKNSYIFVQEYAPFGDLNQYFSKRLTSSASSFNESQVKLVIQQIASALDFIHGLHLVHGDVLLENILVFKQDLSLVKLCDFGSTQSDGTLMVRRVSIGHTTEPTFPPEICDIIPQEKYDSSASSDVWQLGICLVILLTGASPWQVADISDSNYLQYNDWLKRKSLRMPESFKTFTPRLIRLLKRMLEPKPSKRCAVQEVYKYMKDSWIERSAICGGCTRKCPSNTSVNIGRHNSMGNTTTNPSRKESTTSTNSAADPKQRSVSPSTTTITTSTKLVIGQQPITTTATLISGRHLRAKSLKTGEPCHRHSTFRDVSPSVKGLRTGYRMRRCTSYELPSTTTMPRTPSVQRKTSSAAPTNTAEA